MTTHIHVDTSLIYLGIKHTGGIKRRRQPTSHHQIRSQHGRGHDPDARLCHSIGGTEGGEDNRSACSHSSKEGLRAVSED